MLRIIRAGVEPEMKTCYGIPSTFDYLAVCGRKKTVKKRQQSQVQCVVDGNIYLSCRHKLGLTPFVDGK